MSNNSGQRVARLTFSQRFDYAPTPTPMQLEELSSDLRREIWNATREVLIELRSQSMYGYYFGGKARRLVERVLGRVSGKAEDEVDAEYSAVHDLLKVLILESRFSDVLDLLEILSNEHPDGDFASRIADAFEQQAAAYWLDLNQRPVPVFSA